MLDSLFAIHQNVMRQLPLEWKRYLYPQIKWSTQALCLTGARGVGKTTLLLQHYHDRYNSVEKCLYLSADNILVIAEGLFNIAQEYFQYGGEALIIDEIHKYPNWSLEVKNISDTYKNKKILLSGSSSIALSKGLGDLSRRVVFYNLRGLSFREYLLFAHNLAFPPYELKEILRHHVAYANQISSKVSILKCFQQYLQYGFYPFFLEGIDVYQTKLLNIIEKIISEDIPVIFQVSQAKIPVLKKMLWMIATAQPFVPNIERMSKSLGLSKEYTYHFLDYLEKANLVTFLGNQGKGHKLVRKPRKIFLENTNLLAAIAGSLKMSGEIGTIRETFFQNQLQGLVLYSDPIADFLVEGQYRFEIGGKSKKIPAEKRGGKNFYAAMDNIEVGAGNRIPLYLMGFLY